MAAPGTPRCRCWATRFRSPLICRRPLAAATARGTWPVSLRTTSPACAVGITTATPTTCATCAAARSTWCDGHVELGAAGPDVLSPPSRLSSPQFEANTRAFHAVLHAKWDGNGIPRGLGGGAYGLSRDSYGPGRTIDTHRPFRVHTYFETDDEGHFRRMHTTLTQPANAVAGDTASVRRVSFSVSARGSYAAALSASLAAGMTVSAPRPNRAGLEANAHPCLHPSAAWALAHPPPPPPSPLAASIQLLVGTRRLLARRR